MMQEEFRERTKAFLTDGEIGEYATDYEPAYMAAGTISKDDFCLALKNKTARALVVALSRSLVNIEESHRREVKQLTSRIDVLNSDVNELTTRFQVACAALRSVSSTCDRAFTRLDA